MVFIDIVYYPYQYWLALKKFDKKKVDLSFYAYRTIVDGHHDRDRSSLLQLETNSQTITYMKRKIEMKFTFFESVLNIIFLKFNVFNSKTSK